MNAVNVTALVDAFLGIRSAREALLQKFEADDAELKKDQAQIEAALLALCNEVNVDSLKTEHGTVMRQIHERFNCTAWPDFYKFVKDNDAFELFERRIHQSNLRQYVEQHDSKDLPPGVTSSREYKIVVRRANS